MGRLLLLLLIVLTGLSLFFAPWLSGLAYVFNSLLQPQYLWPWIFDGIPIYKITAGLAILGLVFARLQGKVSLDIYKRPQNYMLIGIWIWMHLSHLLSSFPDASVSVSPRVVLDTMNSIFIMYFVLLPFFRAEKPLRYACYVFALVGVYYIYWSNSAYFTQQWHLFSNNRLNGPRSSPYSDGNVLSVLVLMTLPFLILIFPRIKSWMMKAIFGLVVIFAWHSLILFSSRAALLASVVMIVLISYIVRSRKVNLILGISFALFISYQGALVLNRATDTVEHASIEPEQPINPRIVSWTVGLKLIPEYPVFGAGVQKFEAASQAHFPGETPHVAHNTFLNFSVNSGVITGGLFLVLIFTVFRRFREMRATAYEALDFSSYVLLSSSISVLTFFVCSIFLDLVIFEPFYLMLMINLVAWERWIESREGS